MSKLNLPDTQPRSTPSLMDYYKLRTMRTFSPHSLESGTTKRAGVGATLLPMLMRGMHGGGFGRAVRGVARTFNPMNLITQPMGALRNLHTLGSNWRSIHKDPFMHVPQGRMPSDPFTSLGALNTIAKQDPRFSNILNAGKGLAGNIGRFAALPATAALLTGPQAGMYDSEQPGYRGPYDGMQENMERIASDAFNKGFMDKLAMLKGAQFGLSTLTGKHPDHPPIPGGPGFTAAAKSMGKAISGGYNSATSPNSGVLAARRTEMAKPNLWAQPPAGGATPAPQAGNAGGAPVQVKPALTAEPYAQFKQRLDAYQKLVSEPYTEGQVIQPNSTATGQQWNGPRFGVGAMADRAGAFSGAPAVMAKAPVSAQPQRPLPMGTGVGSITSPTPTPTLNPAERARDFWNSRPGGFSMAAIQNRIGQSAQAAGTYAMTPKPFNPLQGGGNQFAKNQVSAPGTGGLASLGNIQHSVGGARPPTDPGAMVTPPTATPTPAPAATPTPAPAATPTPAPAATTTPAPTATPTPAPAASPLLADQTAKPFTHAGYTPSGMPQRARGDYFTGKEQMPAGNLPPKGPPQVETPNYGQRAIANALHGHGFKALGDVMRWGKNSPLLAPVNHAIDDTMSRLYNGGIRLDEQSGYTAQQQQEQQAHAPKRPPTSAAPKDAVKFDPNAIYNNSNMPHYNSTGDVINQG